MTKARPKAYLSRSEVARLFQVAPITVARWADQGKLPFELTLGGQRRYPREGTLAILGEVARRAQETKQNLRARRGARRTRASGAAPFERTRPGLVNRTPGGDQR